MTTKKKLPVGYPKEWEQFLPLLKYAGGYQEQGECYFFQFKIPNTDSALHLFFGRDDRRGIIYHVTGNSLTLGSCIAHSKDADDIAVYLYFISNPQLAKRLEDISNNIKVVDGLSAYGRRIAIIEFFETNLYQVL